MKKIAIFIFLILLLAVSTTMAQKNKKNKKDQPKLTVVDIDERPPAAPIAVVPRKANGSLFSEGATNGDLLRDFKARQLGDLVFINIDESSTATVSSGANRKRDSGTGAGIVPLVSNLPIGGAAVAGSVLGELGQRKFEGAGETTRTSEFTARVAARVVEVLPNGDLRIQAIKVVKINKETEQVALTGIIRTNDLRSDNSVYTAAVGDLRIEFNGKGIASADNAPGWLFRLFDKISPF